MPFFTIADTSDDIQLLHPDVRADAKKEPRVTAEAERYTLAHYRWQPPLDDRTYPINGVAIAPIDWPQGQGWTARDYIPAGAYDHGDGTYTLLRGFHPDPEQCDARLREALQVTIAELVEWRLARRRIPQSMMATEVAVDGKSTKFRQEAARNEPPHWGSALTEFYVQPASRRVWCL